MFLPFNYSFAFWEKDLTVEDESIYNYLQVKETEESVILSTNVAFGVQSIMMKGGGLTGMYYYYALAAPLMAENGEDVLILGLAWVPLPASASATSPAARSRAWR